MSSKNIDNDLYEEYFRKLIIALAHTKHSMSTLSVGVYKFTPIQTPACMFRYYWKEFIK